MGVFQQPRLIETVRQYCALECSIMQIPEGQNLLRCGHLLRMKSAAVAALVFLFVAQCSLAEARAVDEPEANPGRPTVSTPATITPVGYLQLETGFLGAWHSPEFSSRESVNEVLKFAVSGRFEFLTAVEPFVHYQRSGEQPENGTGEVFLGVQGIVHHGEGANPTIAVSYFRRIYDG